MTHDAVQPANQHLQAAMTATASTRKGRWGQRLATATAVYHLARQVHGQIESWRERRQYMVTVMENDDVYGVVQEWVLDRMPEADQRAVTARTRRQHELDDDLAGTVRRTNRRVTLHYDGTRSQHVRIGGHDVEVRIDRSDTTVDGNGGGRLYKPSRVVFVAPDLAARQAVVDFLQAVADSLGGERRKPRLVLATRWGDWQGTSDLHQRSLASVFLPDGHLDGVLDDLRQFLAAEARYAQLGVPWHRGYLFHGPPGTGKSTTAAAMGTELGMDVYALSVSDTSSNGQLNELVGRIPPRSMLLLEDIDVVSAAHDRDPAKANSDAPGVTMDGLLNVLDGLATPHGLVTVMTTNRREVLDPALIRPGRADVELAMGPVCPETFGPMVEYFTGLPCRLYHEYTPDLGAGVPWPYVTPAEVVGVCVENMHDATAARQACLAMLDAKADATFGRTPTTTRP